MATRSLDDKRRQVKVGTERAYDVANAELPGNYPGEDHAWNIDKVRKDLRVGIQRLSRRSVEFDLVGVDASIANAFRRILLAEVPTVAIEHAYVWNSTSVIHDDVLARRLGLAALMEFHKGLAFNEYDHLQTMPTIGSTSSLPLMTRLSASGVIRALYAAGVDLLDLLNGSEALETAPCACFALTVEFFPTLPTSAKHHSAA